MSNLFMALMGIAMLASVSVLLLRNMGFSATPVVVCIALTVIFSLSLGRLQDVATELTSSLAGVQSGEYAIGAMKVIGVGYLAGISSELCESLGEGAIARGVMLAGRVEILLIVMPYFFEILKIGTELVGV